MDQHDLLAAGPAVVLDAATRGAPKVNFHVLAQECAREAYNAAAADDSLAWTDAMVACYAAAAQRVPSEFIRRSMEIPSYGLRVLMILKFGLDREATAAYLRSIVDWLREAMIVFVDAQEFARALDSANEGEAADQRALILRERLEAASALWKRGIVGEDLEGWFRAIEQPDRGP